MRFNEAPVRSAGLLFIPLLFEWEEALPAPRDALSYDGNGGSLVPVRHFLELVERNLFAFEALVREPVLCLPHVEVRTPRVPEFVRIKRPLHLLL